MEIDTVCYDDVRSKSKCNVIIKRFKSTLTFISAILCLAFLLEKKLWCDIFESDFDKIWEIH